MRLRLDAGTKVAAVHPRRRRAMTEGAASGGTRTTDEMRRRQRVVASVANAAAASANETDYDRMPALYVSEDAFSLPSYWDQRYQGQSQGEAEEWYRSDRCESTAAVVAAHLTPSLPVLQLGVGTSRLQEAMARGFCDNENGGDGEVGSGDCFASVLSVDFSAVAVARQQARLEELMMKFRSPSSSSLSSSWPSRLSYARADVRSMPQYSDGQFGGGLLDKGALDALLCGDDADGDALRCLKEVWRLLPGGTGEDDEECSAGGEQEAYCGSAYVMITSAAPEARRRLLPTGASGGGEEGGDFPVWAGVLVYRLGQQGALAGPCALGDEGGERALLAAHEEDGRFAYSHYAYVCVKG